MAALKAEKELARRFWQADGARGHVLTAEVDGADLLIRWHDPAFPFTKPVARVSFDQIFYRLNKSASEARAA